MDLKNKSGDMSVEPFYFKFLSLTGSKGQTDLSHADQAELGGKALGLLNIYQSLNEINPDDFPGISINIPDMVVIGTSLFDAYMQRNQLFDVALSTSHDNRIADTFQKATMPFEVLRELRNLVQKWKMPLAIRSSSLLEDSLNQPFAGIYLTKMIPNNAHNLEVRFQKLIEAIKFVWASTYFSLAKDYCKATGLDIQNEKMAVIIQKMVGKQHRARFYPELSGVARSYNFYPVKPAQPEDGVASLALGLGKTIVDGHITWTYSPKYPQMPPPYNDVQDMLNNSQNKFWAVIMGQVYEYNPIKETEFIQEEDLRTAEKDGVLSFLASTFDPESGRLSTGTGLKGPRVLTFAPLLSHNEISINDLIVSFLNNFSKILSCPVEIEFAMTFSPHCFSLLQIRPMKIHSDYQQISVEDLNNAKNLVASKTVFGDGILDGLKDIVYVMPGRFDIQKTKQIAKELENHNQRLLAAEIPYLLIVFGRLGTLDPWLGIPVTWGQVCGAKVIVEATQENMKVELSQGSHYFHNIINLDVKYFSLPFSQPYRIQWDLLKKQEVVKTCEYTQHVRLSSSLLVKVDGRSGWGVIQLVQ